MAILGGGPASSTLAALLARSGLRTAIFHVPKSAPLIVGESLVPGIIPILQELGVEDEVRAYSMYKPGASINLSDKFNFHFSFSNIRGPLPRYAYNVPRDRFDETLLNAARKAGVKIVEAHADLERVLGTDRVQLSAATLALTDNFFSGSPDLIVDGTGRLRLLPKLLGIGAREGGRKDTALFAHVDKTQLDFEGHVHTTRLDHGWSWRIPLPGKVSVGMVIGTEHLPKFGATKEERYDNLLKQDSVLRRVAGEAKRLTPVLEYTNYQLVSERMFGENWALVGDSAGFVDPVFSSGLLVGMRGAISLAEAIQHGSQSAFEKYQGAVSFHLGCWHEIAVYFYDGRLFNSIVVGQEVREHYKMMRVFMPHIENRFARVLTGAAGNWKLSLGMLRWVINYGLKKRDPALLRIY